ncbi:MAG: phytoene/squalene synthase family protein [Pseudomonadota bacterium]
MSSVLMADSMGAGFEWLDDKQSDLAVCREMLRVGSHSFYAASLLLPQDMREPACALYAFCRLADDLVDDGADDVDAVSELTRRLNLIYSRKPYDHAADRAMVHIAERYGMPKALPAALIDGFRWDVDGRHYETLDDLHGYAARVAGSVGAMMAVLMGVREAPVLARACDLGSAMQLTNIARDVGEDAQRGRLYLPRDWMREAGINPDRWLEQPEFSEALGTVVARLLTVADELYLRARSGIAQLPLGCRPGIYAAMRIYREIGVVLRHDGLNSVDQRTIVPKHRKSFLLGHAMLSSVKGQALDSAPALPANQFLVDAVAGAPAPRPEYSYWFRADAER